MASEYALKFKATLDTNQVNSQLKSIQANLPTQQGSSGGSNSFINSASFANIDRAATTVNLRQTTRALNLFGSALEQAARNIGDNALGESIHNVTTSLNSVIQGFNALGPGGAIIGGVIATLNLISESAAGFADLQQAAREAGDELWGASNAVTSYSAAQAQLQAATVELKNKMFDAQRSQADYFDVAGQQKQAAKELRDSAKAHREAALLLRQYSAKLDAAYSSQERAEEILYGPMEKRFSTAELENKASDIRSQLEGALKLDPETVDDLDKYNKDLNNLISEYSKVSTALAKSRDVDTSRPEKADFSGLLDSKGPITSIARIGGSIGGEDIVHNMHRDLQRLVLIEYEANRRLQTLQTATGAPSI